MEQNNFDIKKVKVHRTLEGTIFEAVILALLIAAWIVGFLSRPLAGDNLIILCVFTGAALLSAVMAYWPSHINLMSIQLTNICQTELAIRLSRVLGVELALAALVFAIIGHESPLTPFIAIGLAIVLTITAFLFMFLIQKAE